MKRLTIITPTLNCASTMQAALDSIRPLLDEGAEHIVVDSGSTDGTVELAKAAGARILSHPRGNMYEAINAGVRASDRPWLTYLNGDDVVYADALRDMLGGFSESGDILYGNIDLIDQYNRFLFYWRSASPARVRCMLQIYCAVFQQGTLFRREVFDRLDGFDTQYRFSADYDFFFRASVKGFRFHKYTKKTVGGFRLLPAQLSQSRKGEMAPEGLRNRRQYWSQRSVLVHWLTRVYSFVYRNLINMDSRLMRRYRGLGLDNRQY